MYVVIVPDAFAGPPSVRIQTMSKICSEPITVMKPQIRMVGASSGSVMRRVTCHGLAPSMAAACFSSTGMFCSPASSSTIPKPRYCQVSTTKTVNSTTCTFASQSWTRPPRPNALSTWSAKPLGCRISDHMTPVTAGGST